MHFIMDQKLICFYLFLFGFKWWEHIKHERINWLDMVFFGAQFD
jgi:hypothetical protein